MRQKLKITKRMVKYFISKECRSSRCMLIVSIDCKEYEIEGNRCKGQEYVARDISCPCGKDVYLSYKDAERALRQRGAEKKDSKRIYKCSICRHYHLTTNDGVGKHKKKYDRNKSKNYVRRSICNYSEAELKELKERNERAFNLKAFRNRISLAITL